MNWSEGNEEQNPHPPSAAEDDLFVFGYSCKVFRDDEKASWIEDGKHLIPWMGDSESGLLVDRYDGRGALMDLRKYEPPLGGANYLENLTPEELRIEKLCDQERYRDFDEDAEYDENIYQEAEFKRLQMAVNEMDKDREVKVKEIKSTKEYGSVGYTYSDNQMLMGPEPKKFQDELPYTQPQDLMIPCEILHPLTMKSHAIIEKTAKFIASHGTQMEIILKTKQAKNPQFDFLSHNDPLNPYYKFLVYAIKNNLYKPPDEIAYPDESSSSGSDKGNESGDNSSGDDDGYLHPSLVKTSSDITQFIPKGSFKPSSNCSYSMLVSKIREVSSEQNARSSANNASSDLAENNDRTAIASRSTNHSTNSISGFPSASDVPTPQQIHSMPHSQDQLIIEKMANYVVKNGPDFEMMARTKGDPRFAFLDTTHEHNWYYVSCKERSLMEAKAVVASKGFVSYTKVESENAPSLAPSQQQNLSVPTTSIGGTLTSTSNSFPRAQSQSSTGTISAAGKTVNSVNRIRLKDSSAAKGKVDKEKLIKISSSLPNFTSVLKQKSIEDEEENLADKDLDAVNCKLSTANKDKDEDEIRRIKEERRKKAALFLQRIQKTDPIAIQTTSQDAPPTIPEVVSDVESVPSPTNPKSELSPVIGTAAIPRVEIPCQAPSGISVESVNTQSVQNRQRKSTDSPLSPITNADVTMESREVIRERVKSSGSKKRDKYRDRGKNKDEEGGSRNRSDRRSRSRHNHRDRRSRSSSLSDSNDSSSTSSSYSSRRKKSKRKHSKKSHKKRDRSRSKKSKKHRR